MKNNKMVKEKEEGSKSERVRQKKEKHLIKEEKRRSGHGRPDNSAMSGSGLLDSLVREKKTGEKGGEDRQE